MIEITFKELKKEIDKYFNIISHEQPIKVKTEKYNVVILSEKEYNNLKNLNRF